MTGAKVAAFSLAAAAGALLLPDSGKADLVPLSIAPVSVDLTVTVPGDTLTDTGTDRASTSASFSGLKGEGGRASVAVTTLSDRIAIVMSGEAFALGTATGVSVRVDADVAIEFDVPEVGYSMTRIAYDFTDPIERGPWFLLQAEGGWPGWQGIVLIPNFHVPENFTSTMLLKQYTAGDHVLERLRISISKDTDTTGSFKSIVEFRLQSRLPDLAPAIETADVNAGDLVDILDETPIGRALAGLGRWP